MPITVADGTMSYFLNLTNCGETKLIRLDAIVAIEEATDGDFEPEEDATSAENRAMFYYRITITYVCGSEAKTMDLRYETEAERTTYMKHILEGLNFPK